MDQIPTKGTLEYTDYVISLAKGPTLQEGVINEPRVYFDSVVTDTTAKQWFGSPDSIFNRELFPVRMTHMTSSMGYGFEAELLGLYGLQLRYHDQFYMNSQFVTIPAWVNKVVAAPDPVSNSVASWDLIAGGAKPVILSKQDTLQVQVALNDDDAPDNSVPVIVSFTGFGLLSKRPYFFSGRFDLADIAIHTIPSNFYRNDGNEPIVLTDMSVLVGPENASQLQDLQGDIRRVRLNVRQMGSGTGSWWFSTTNPMLVTSGMLCPAQLLGITTGRAAVHQFPGNGQLFGPGDGISLAVQQVNELVVVASPAQIFFAFTGYIMVT